VTSCESCKAPILWAVTESGKRMPLDAKPEKRILLEEDGCQPPVAHVIDVYVSHFATCPQAAQHRRRR